MVAFVNYSLVDPEDVFKADGRREIPIRFVGGIGELRAMSHQVFQRDCAVRETGLERIGSDEPCAGVVGTPDLWLSASKT
jgi:hypothetical protein